MSPFAVTALCANGMEQCTAMEMLNLTFGDQIAVVRWTVSPLLCLGMVEICVRSVTMGENIFLAYHSHARVHSWASGVYAPRSRRWLDGVYGVSLPDLPAPLIKCWAMIYDNDGHDFGPAIEMSRTDDKAFSHMAPALKKLLCGQYWTSMRSRNALFQWSLWAPRKPSLPI